MQRQHTIAFRVLSLAVSAVLLFSSVGIAVEVHRCGGDVQSIGIYAPSDHCEMMEDAPVQCEARQAGEKPIVQAPSCCSTDASYTVLDTETDLNSNLGAIEFQALEAPTFRVDASLAFAAEISQFAPDPLPVGPRHILYQRFLI